MYIYYIKSYGNKRQSVIWATKKHSNLIHCWCGTSNYGQIYFFLLVVNEPVCICISQMKIWNRMISKRVSYKSWLLILRIFSFSHKKDSKFKNNIKKKSHFYYIFLYLYIKQKKSSHGDKAENRFSLKLFFRKIQEVNNWQ